MRTDKFRLLIEHGDSVGVKNALASVPALANESDPLHYVSDCVGNGWLANETASEITELLLSHGAALDGTQGRESPLTAAVSLGAARVARVLIESGAELEATSIFGARALHWAAWMGMKSSVALLITHGASIEPKCTEFGATPLFWAVHGYGPNGPKVKYDQVGPAQLLIESPDTTPHTSKFITAKAFFSINSRRGST